ncbi:RIP metalloprotease RseP [Geofilum rhodophaeum]|uniref:RIP metalloprotease RseP n=1 Tax=Geofilum rhodophaeum TaxID=1965019 RepID=UPI000B522EA6|nr:RIP metalloprotease RseP [Geofilum rhodophaeum]
MDFFIKVLQLILSLSILVILHEFGHFFFARLFKTRVEKFYLFFDAGFSLFKFKKGDTEYGLGWLPLGGYVKISGMIDESMDKEQLAQEPKPYEFRSKPAWQRLLIMVGGVVVNFITAIVIFWMILFRWGDAYIPAENARYGLYFHPVAHEIGLQDGDKILAIDGNPVEEISSIVKMILVEEGHAMQVQRGDSLFVLNIPADFNQRILAEEVRVLASYQIPTIVDSVQAGSGAARAGLQRGDSIVALDTAAVPYFHQFSDYLSELAGKTTQATVYRNGEALTLPVEVNEDGLMGFFVKDPASILGVQEVQYGFWEAFPAGISKGVNVLSDYVKQLKLVFSPEGAKQLGGFGTIGSLFPSAWDWQIFWHMTAFLSIILAFMNILPIPALDGGHVMFLLYEIVARRKPSDKFMEYAQMTGMILLFGLLIFANGNDLYRWLFK